jgi:hypothetical protein
MEPVKTYWQTVYRPVIDRELKPTVAFYAAKRNMTEEAWIAEAIAEKAAREQAAKPESPTG